MIPSDKPLVSIIIPTYGRAHFLGEAIRSALNQTYTPVEVIVVDDNGEGSEAQQAVASLLLDDEFSSISYLVNPHNMGVAASRNRAAHKANGEYLAFLDDDDVFEPGKVEEHMLMAPQVGLSLCGFYQTDEALHCAGVQHQPYISSIADFLTHKVFTQASTQFIDKDLFFLAGGYPEDLSFREDSILVMRILAVGGVLGTLDKPLFKHRKHQSDRLSKKKHTQSELDHIHARWCQEQDKLLAKVDKALADNVRFKREYDYFKVSRLQGKRFGLPYLLKLMRMGLSAGKFGRSITLMWKAFV